MAARKVATGVAAVVLCVAMAGCTPAVRGAVGVSISSAGVPIALLAPCEGEVTGVALSIVDQDGFQIELLKRWDLERGDAPTEVPLEAPLTELAESHHYQLSAGSQHDAWPSGEYKRLEYAWFDLDDIARLTPDLVVHGFFNGGHGGTITSTRAQFEKSACP